MNHWKLQTTNLKLNEKAVLADNYLLIETSSKKTIEKYEKATEIKVKSEEFMKNLEVKLKEISEIKNLR